MRPSKIGGKDTPIRLSLEWTEPDDALKKALRKDVETVLFQLQRDVTRDEDRESLVRMVVELRAMTDVKWNALISLPSCEIIRYIRECIQNKFRDLDKVN